MVFTVYIVVNANTQGGNCGIYAGTTPDELQQLMPAVTDEIKKVCQEKVSPKELERAKAQIKASLLMALESSSATSEAMARQTLLFNRVLPVEEIVEKIEKVSLEDICETACRIFGSKPTYTLLGALKKYPTADELEKMIK